MAAMLLSPLARLGVIGGILLALFVYRGVLVHERDQARAQLADAQSKCAELKSANASLAQQISLQNAAVDAIKRDADGQVRAMDARMRAAAGAAESAESRAEADADTLARAPIAGGCDQAIAWGREQARELGTW